MDQRLAFIDKRHDQLSIRKQCELLNVYRSMLYYRHKNDEIDVWLMNLIRDIWLECQLYALTAIPFYY